MCTSIWQIQVFFKIKIEEVRLRGSAVVTLCRCANQGTEEAWLVSSCIAIQRINTVLMTERESGQGNCILGLCADVGTNTWYESHIF